MKGRSVHDLLRDYQAAAARTRKLPASQVGELCDFERFLRRRQHILARDPAQLWSQASGQNQDSAVRRKVEKLSGPAGRWWFRALHPLPESQWELTIDVGCDVHCVALWEQGGRRIALAGCEDGSIRRYDLGTGQDLKPALIGHTGGVLAVALGGDGRHALSGSQDSTLRWWDLEAGSCRHVLQGHTGGVTAVALSGDGSHALSGSLDRTLRWWDVEGGTCIATFFWDYSITSLSRSPPRGDGPSRVVAGDEAGHVLFFELAPPSDA